VLYTDLFGQLVDVFMVKLKQRLYVIACERDRHQKQI
jgi:hypothetical protein